MQRVVTKLLWGFATACWLLAGCARNKADQPTPALAAQASTTELQAVFNQNQYEQQLPKGPAGSHGFKWVPNWQATSWQRPADSVRYAFVPLEAIGATPVNVLGVKHYVRFRQTARQTEAAVVSYCYKLPKGDVRKLLHTPFSIDKFTGEAYVKDLKTGLIKPYTYVRGVRTQSASQLAKKQPGSASATNDDPPFYDCHKVYFCLWRLTCSRDLGFFDFPVDIATSGYDCDVSNIEGITLACGDTTQYELLDSEDTDICYPDPSNPNPGNPDPDPVPDPTDPTHPFADGLYYFRTYDDNLEFGNSPLLGVDGDSQQPRALVSLQNQNYSHSTLWQLTFNQADNTYTVQNVNSGLMLDVQWGSTSAGAPIWQWPANGGAAQKWLFVAVPGTAFFPNRYVIVSYLSGLAMQEQNGAYSPKGPGVQMEQNTVDISGNAPWQYWYIGKQ